MPFRSPLKLFVLLAAIAFLFSFNASAKPLPKKKTRKAIAAKSDPIFGGPIVVPPAPPTFPSSLTASIDEPTKRILNIRLHPIYIGQMILNKDVVASGRVDLDFILGDRFTLGPSLIYTQKSSLDDIALAAGTGQQLDETFLEVGLLANIYLNGTTSTGGFILRPHVYWIDVNGEKANGDGAVTAASTASQSGARAGAEFIYQKILGNGFNFEVGGGFTYHMVPYSIEYPAGGIQKTEPDSRIQPSVSLAIGWAF